MKHFIDHIQQSIFGPDYYRDLPSHPRSYSWKYYWSFSMLLAVVMTIVTSIPMVPQVNRVLREFPERLIAYYPDDLELRMDHGVISSNVVEPYFLPLPKELALASDNAPAPKYLAVIDTQTPVSYEQFKTYSSYIWIGGRAIAVIDQDQGVRISPVTGNEVFTLNESVVRGFLESVRPYFSLVSPLLVVFLFLAFLMRFVFLLLYLLFAALLILLLGRILKRAWTYGVAYRIGLHAVTLPLLLEQVLSLLPNGGLHLPFLFTGLLLLCVFLNHRGSAPSAASPAPSDAPAL